MNGSRRVYPIGGIYYGRRNHVHVDYDLYNAETGHLIETTREEVAKEQKCTKREEHTPLFVLSCRNSIAGFEDALAEAEADKDITVEISAEDAYGEKDPTQIETISIDASEACQRSSVTVPGSASKHQR